MSRHAIINEHMMGLTITEQIGAINSIVIGLLILD